MTILRRVWVFCGSSEGASPEYAEAARAVGRVLADNALTLVCGGASAGLMGVLADTVLEAGGRVVGVMPRDSADQEVAHPGLTELRVVETVPEWKQELADLADAFLALPGGLGTLEELFEVWTWGAPGVHEKPVGLLNTGDYYTSLLKFVDDTVVERFVRESQRGMLVVSRDPEELLRALADFRPPETRRSASSEDLC